ncbi:histidine triad nucleotide-binding protein [Inmirania thermothiophila]|uniref:Histidine triad (HIT) family protein n=1 Tax=Inmirania thermothiophila TaxID=1750597 RepID=A0A3N1Y6T9_9GAMM|nr:histidine triad nucleotide-binding protein [Inmirania thermothiophila]ROR34470.1 histidine triad (HIT) family protein [Inmirania thermothiophila]
MSCVFCDIVAGRAPARFVHQDEQVVAFHDIHPKAPVHVLVVPRVHVASLDHLGPEHEALVLHIIRLLPGLARRLGLAEGYRTVVNTGRGGGQIVDHLHLHLLGGFRHPGR